MKTLLTSVLLVTLTACGSTPTHESVRATLTNDMRESIKNDPQTALFKMQKDRDSFDAVTWYSVEKWEPTTTEARPYFGRFDKGVKTSVKFDLYHKADTPLSINLVKFLGNGNRFDVPVKCLPANKKQPAERCTGGLTDKQATDLVNSKQVRVQFVGTSGAVEMSPIMAGKFMLQLETVYLVHQNFK